MDYIKLPRIVNQKLSKEEKLSIKITVAAIFVMLSWVLSILQGIFFYKLYTFGPNQDLIAKAVIFLFIGSICIGVAMNLVFDIGKERQN